MFSATKDVQCDTKQLEFDVTPCGWCMTSDDISVIDVTFAVMQGIRVRMREAGRKLHHQDESTKETGRELYEFSEKVRVTSIDISLARIVVHIDAGRFAPNLFQYALLRDSMKVAVQQSMDEHLSKLDAQPA